MAIENEKNPKNQMHYYSDLGLIYYLEKEIDSAMECYTEADNLLKKYKISQSDTASLHYYRIGLLLSGKGSTDEARQMLQKSMDITENPTEKGSCLLNIGLSYKRDGTYNLAIDYYQKALELFESIKDYRKIAVAYNNLAELYRVKGMYKIGLGYIETSMSYWEYLNESNKAISTHTYYQISLALNANINFDKLIEVLNNTDGKCKYKRIIIEILETIIHCGKIRSIGILYQVKDIINDYLHRPILDSFCEEIMKIYGDISLYIEDVERR
jgi:tetratricopeptide (TPR) repeat protein